MVHQEVEVVEAVLLLLLDRHGRSHNIAAECCVWSSRERVVCGLMSRFSKAGGRDVGKVASEGSCLMLMSASSKRSSASDAGLAGASIEPRDSTSDDAGVSTLSVHSVTSGRIILDGSGPCSLR